MTNLDEFLAQTDPIRADTDGDGLSDADELAGLSSGAPDLDPLVPATFLADEPDTDGNGVPDLWENAGLPSYWGVDAQGFPEYVEFPEPAATNYDVRLTVTSSRHAALDWGDGTLLLPVCTNLVLRLRLGSDAVKTVTLSPAPSAASSPGGAWKASVRAEWDPRRGLPTEGNRVALDNGTMVDRSVSESRFVGVLPPPSRASLPWGLIRPDMVFVPKSLHFSPDPAQRFLCADHDVNPQVGVSTRNLGQDFLAWLENGVPAGTAGGEIDLLSYLAPECRPFLDRLSFSLNGVSCGETISLGSKPDILYPTMMTVSVWKTGTPFPLDTMIITVFTAKEVTRFSAWKNQYSSMANWIADLPFPPQGMPITESINWHQATIPGAYMHHNAAFEARSTPVPGGHGHQATYDDSGRLICSTIAAGTADFVSPDTSKSKHRNEDVYPYLFALHLDGNPGCPDNGTGLFTEMVPSRLSLPCIHQGSFLDRYIQLRPSLAFGFP